MPISPTTRTFVKKRGIQLSSGAGIILETPTKR